MADRARILIAEDQPEGLELLEAYLDAADYDIETAADGEDALKKVQSFHPELILLDVMMPRISGFEVCKRLKSAPETRGIVILMITALDQHHDIDRAVEVGTNDFLTKPINKTELLLRIKAAARRAGKSRTRSTRHWRTSKVCSRRCDLWIIIRGPMNSGLFPPIRRRSPRPQGIWTGVRRPFVASRCSSALLAGHARPNSDNRGPDPLE